MIAIQNRTISNKIDYWLKDFWHEYGDPRIESYPLMDTFGHLVTFVVVWLLFVTVIGPRLMRNRKPFSLKPLLFVYNLAMSLINAAFFVHYFFTYNYGLDVFNFTFVPVNDNRPETLTRISYSHVYFLTKIVDLLETVFFVLRKKHNQVSFLHVYHHTTVCLMGWVYFRTNGGFNVTAFHFAVWNSFVHAFMYAYYGLAVLGPAVQPFLWWKRYLTQLQIVQFVSIFVHGAAFCVLQRGYPFFFSVDVMFQASMYLWLFGRFYRHTYLQQKRTLKQD